MGGTNLQSGSLTISNGILSLGAAAILSNATPITLWSNATANGVFLVSSNTIMNPWIANTNQVLSGIGTIAGSVIMSCRAVSRLESRMGVPPATGCG